MGGQQFGTDSLLLDMNDLGHVVAFDRASGEIEVEAGMQWPELYRYLIDDQTHDAHAWTFAQKQTGADRISVGGSLSCNAHGRGLSMPPMVGDVVAFTLVDHAGNVLRCSRRENVDLFRAAIGGYGLFGAIATVRLRLVPRHKVQRCVEVIEIEDLPRMFEQRIAAGFEFGEFQFATDVDSDALLRRGVLSCHGPVDDSSHVPDERRVLSVDQWKELAILAHTDRARAFEEYAGFQLTTSGQVYWSDEHQMTTYVDDYHRALGPRLGEFMSGGDMTTEIYVPRGDLVSFMSDVRRDLRANRADLVYGAIRLIERDVETLLPWAREPYACVVFNLHVSRGPAGIQKARQDFRRLIDRGLWYAGSFHLTYHRWADRAQLLAAHPAFPDFLRAKREFDPEERFTSDWYRHYRALVTGE
jgi:FAD/FMN-containing dehydrogenase